jgi:hypothetical protein
VIGHIFLGIVASLTVPLFLTLVQSQLAEKLFTGEKNLHDDWFVYVGICLVAAISFRAFVAAVSGEVLATLEHHSQRIQDNAEHIQHHHERLTRVEEKQQARAASETFMGATTDSAAAERAQPPEGGLVVTPPAAQPGHAGAVEGRTDRRDTG